MRVLTSTKGLESLNAIPEDYDDADYGGAPDFFRPPVVLPGTRARLRAGSSSPLASPPAISKKALPAPRML